MTRKKMPKPIAKELEEKIRRAAAEGRIEMAPPPAPELVPPLEFCRHFSEHILHHEWDTMLLTEESEVTDIRWGEREAILADLERVYGVDCSDMQGLNIWRVMQRCLPGGHC